MSSGGRPGCAALPLRAGSPARLGARHTRLILPCPPPRVRAPLSPRRRPGSKVTIVGTGAVGLAAAYSILNQGICAELVLIDVR